MSDRISSNESVKKLCDRLENEREEMEDLNAQPDIIEFKKVFNGRVDIKSVLSEE